MKTSSLNTSIIAFVLAMVTNTNINLSAAFSQPQQQKHKAAKQEGTLPSSRRAFFGIATASLLGSGIIQPAPSSAAIKTGASNPFTGDYDDPNHPGCLRQVKVVGAPLGGNGVPGRFPVMEITGWDGPEGAKACTAPPPSRDVLWQIQGQVKSPSTAFLDFSPKGGPANIEATYENGKIIFPDGNKWKKTSEKKERRPQNMSTLNSGGPSFRERDDDE